LTCLLSRRLASACILILCGALAAMPAAADEPAAPEVLDLAGAAALLQVEPATVRELAEAERIPARRVGDAWRFAREALLEWLKGERFAGMAIVPPGRSAPLNLAGTSIADPAAVSARGRATGAELQLAQAGGAAKPEPAAQPATVGERSTAPTAGDIALRDQVVLLRRNAGTVDFGVAYARSEQTLSSLARTEQNAFAATGTLRYGLRDDLQLTARLPGVWRRNATFVDASVPAVPSSTMHQSYGGDASVSLLGVAAHEASGRPNLIWSLDGVAPTGPGDAGLGGGLVVSKSFDPAVLFAGINYLRGTSIDAADSRRTLARNNFGFNFGYTYALNDMLALNTVLNGSYRTTRSADGIAIPPARERYQLQLGMTWMLTPRLFIEPAVGIRLGGSAPDLTLSVNLPYSF
jgi:excisionase family DNA binding protein